MNAGGPVLRSFRLWLWHALMNGAEVLRMTLTDKLDEPITQALTHGTEMDDFERSGVDVSG